MSNVAAKMFKVFRANINNGYVKKTSECHFQYNKMLNLYWIFSSELYFYKRRLEFEDGS
jgi:hypothetical protein